MVLGKISITPVGTCRIATPLKRGATRYPIRLDFGRIYGFVHTSKEALQQLQYRAGELVFPTDIAPILLRPGHEQEREPASAPADLTIVEVSSHKSYMVDGVAVQSNYVSRYFSDLLASPQRARTYWTLATRGDRAQLKAYLEKPGIARLVSEEDRSLLERMSYRLQTQEEVAADMATIADMVGKDKLLFVTHLNALTPGGELIASRDKIIRWVKQAAERIGVECFDPTDLMFEFGQERAMEREGADLTHCTNSFYDRWYAHVQRTYLLPQLDPDAGAEVTGHSADAAILAETIAAALEYDDFFGGTRQLFAALRAYPDYVPMKLLHGRLLEQLGDYEGARELLAPLADADEMTSEIRQSLMRALLETGDNVGALAVARQMLADEYENEQIYEAAGLAAERLGAEDDAIRYRKLAFRLNPANHDAGLAVLNAYRARGGAESIDVWLEELLELTERDGTPASTRAVAEWALREREHGVLGAVMLVLARKDMAHLPSLIEDIIGAGMQEALVPTAAAIGALPNLTEKAGKTLAQLAVGWSEKAETALAEKRFLEAHTFASACLSIQPRNGLATRVQRLIASELREQMRAVKGDEPRIRALGAAAGELVFRHKAIATPYAEALVADGQYAEAEAVYTRLHQDNPEDHEIAANLAHVAELNGNYHIALETYGKLAAQPELAEVTKPWVVKRVRRFMEQARSKGVRKARELTAEERFEDAITVVRLLDRFTGPNPKLDEELGRIRKTLRAYLRRLDDDGMEPHASLSVLKLMLSIEPNDASALRRAALDAMKLEDYGEAVGYWERFNELMPGNATAVQSIKRCRIRLSRKERGPRTVRSLAA